MSSKTPQLFTVVGVIVVILIALLLAGGADVLFPAPTPTPRASATFTPIPTRTATATARPIAANLVLLHTNDTLGYLDPCNV